MQAPNIFRYVRPLIALIVVVLSFAFLFYICMYPVPEQNKDMIQLAAGLELKKEYGIRDAAYMTSCYTCHR